MSLGLFSQNLEISLRPLPIPQSKHLSDELDKRKTKTRRNLDNERQGERHKRQMKKADSVSQDAPLSAWLMNGNRCVCDCAVGLEDSGLCGMSTA